MLEFLQSLAIYSIGAVVVLVVWNLWLEWRLRKLTRGSSGKNLEKHVGQILKEYEQFAQLKELIEAIDKRLSGSIRGVGVVRFNPFQGSGSSKPSFAAAFLTEEGAGVVLSTLHARESLSIFSKEIAQFSAEQELTEEEAQALEKAKDSMHNAQ